MAAFLCLYDEPMNGIPKGVYSLWSGQGLTALVGCGAKPHSYKALRKGEF